MDKGKLQRGLIIGLYVLGALSAAVVALGVGILRHVGFSVAGIFVCGIAVCLPVGAAVILQVRQESGAARKGEIAKRFLWAVFCIYIVLLAGLLFLGSYRYYRGSMLPFWETFQLNTNFVPGKTILRYITGYAQGSYNTIIVVHNLLGNLLLFAPAGLLLPCLFERLRSFRLFVPAMLAALVLVEGGQLLLRVGMCDIDDVILNLAGACLFFGLWKLEPVQRLLRKLYLLPAGEAAEALCPKAALLLEGGGK